MHGKSINQLSCIKKITSEEVNFGHTFYVFLALVSPDRWSVLPHPHTHPPPSFAGSTK